VLKNRWIRGCGNRAGFARATPCTGLRGGEGGDDQRIFRCVLKFLRSVRSVLQVLDHLTVCLYHRVQYYELIMHYCGVELKQEVS
jgi:hypothetical protein